TTVFSHEYAEAVTDPDGSAYQVEPRNVTNWNEISDGEAQNYTFRVNNYLLQAYYSQRDSAYVVPNGSTNNFLVSTTRALSFGVSAFGHNEIFMNTVGNGVYAELNSSTAQFDPGAISAIQVNTGNGGTNGVTIAGTPVPVNVQGNAANDLV